MTRFHIELIKSKYIFRVENNWTMNARGNCICVS